MADSKSIILSSYNTVNPSKNVLNLPLPFPVHFEKQEVALANVFIYYSWSNVSSTYSNTQCQYTFNGSTYTVNFPAGFYQVSDLNAFIQSQMYSAGQYLLDQNGNPVYYLSIVSNYVYYSNTLTCTPIPSSLPTGYTNPNNITLSGVSPQLIVNQAGWGSLIGFATGTYPASPSSTTYQSNGTLVPQISPTTTVNVNCNLVNNNRFNSYPQSIYTFSANTTYGSQIQIVPYQLIYYPVLDGWFNSITITLTDQNNVALTNVDPNLVATLIVRNRA
jgi:hypothetical protein